MSKKAIYLSGWEYNRLLAENPLLPRMSALPSHALWNGAAQFWLFERVYCTKDSLKAEKEASEALGWATGRIFSELQEKGILVPIDWQEDTAKTPELQRRILEAHRQLREQHGQIDIATLIKTGDAAQLDLLKLQLLCPLLDHFDCINNLSTNSVDTWYPEGPSAASGTSRTTSEAVRILTQPFEKRGLHIETGGLHLCDPPGTGVPAEEYVRQRMVQETIEKPLISELLAGRIPHYVYLEALAPHRDVFKPVNQKMLSDWNAARDKLFYLRDQARENLWPQLHSDWLPRLEKEPEFLPEFQTLVRDALLAAKFRKYLDKGTFLVIVAVSAAIASTALQLGAELGVPPAISGMLGGGGAMGAKHLLSEELKERLDTVRKLSLFYQKTLKR